MYILCVYFTFVSRAKIAMTFYLFILFYNFYSYRQKTAGVLLPRVCHCKRNEKIL